MAETIIKPKEKAEDEKTFDQIDINKNSDDHGKKDRNIDHEIGWGSTTGEEGLLRTHDHKEQYKGLIIYSGPHSVSLSSLHRVQSSSKEGDNSSENSVQEESKNTWFHIMVLIASCIAVLICTGIIGSMSVFYVELLSEFPNLKTRVSLVPSLANGIYDIGGVVAGIMIDSIGCRWCIIIGTVLTCVPCALSFMFHDLTSLIILLGVVCAFGSSIVMLTGMVRVGRIFGPSHRFASVMISGAHPLGFAIFPPIMSKIIYVYGWRGALLTLSAITLNILPFGLLATTSIGATSPLLQR